MTDDRPDTTNDGAGALALAPVGVDLGWAAEPVFDLPMLAPAPVPVIDQAALGEILADSLFGDVIELGDMIPHLLAHSGDAGAEQVPTNVASAADMAGEAMIFHVPFSILFEEDGSSGHGTL